MIKAKIYHDSITANTSDHKHITIIKTLIISLQQYWYVNMLAANIANWT